MPTTGYADLNTARSQSGHLAWNRRLAVRRRDAAHNLQDFWRGLAILSVALLGALLLLSAQARSETADPARPGARSFDDAPHGLLFRASDGRSGFLAPMLATDVRMAISGTVQRVTVRQHFINPSNAWLEGVYIFPLPERAAVDRLVMQIGDRRIVGRIEERAQAQAIYEAAAASGQQASLVSQERPNLFTSQVANVGPGETIVVEIAYQDAVAIDNGRYSVRFPMVVAPRYMPQSGFVGVEFAPDEDGAPAPGASDGARIDGPVRRPGDGPANSLTLAIDLDPGFPLGELTSLYHPIAVRDTEGGARHITLAEGAVPANRDFVLEWTPAAGSDASAALFAEERRTDDGALDTHLLVSLTPPAGAAPAARLPRDVVFVIDVSGSMAGTSIEQARVALNLAIDRLSPGDRFNVIRFNHETSALFPSLRPWNAETLRSAQVAVARLDADGGTEMQPALRLALDRSGDGTEIMPAGTRLHQVVFLTDAAVGNEAELFDDIAARLGDSRLFTIGIGSAPNSYFMRKAAELGRGSYSYIGDIAEVGERMKALLARLESPVLTDITITWPQGLQGKVEAFPQPVPDLYRGEPVAFTARLNGVAAGDLDGTVEINATTAGGGNWTAQLPLGELRQAPGVASVWARAKLEAIEDRQWRGADPDGVRGAAVTHALAYDLVSAYTSLVAVDEAIVRGQEDPLHRGEVARDLPEGWIHDEVFGETAAPADPATLPAPEALMQRISLPGALQADSLRLPATATTAELQMLFGAALLLLALASLAVGRRLGNLPALSRRGRGQSRA